MAISDLLYYSLFLWLDESVTRYWVAAWICFAAFLLTSLFPHEPGRRWRQWNHPVIYLATLGLAMLAFRWPLMAATTEFNPDESQLLAGAITAWHRHVIGSLDVGYCGPWSYLPLALPALFGFPIDFVGGRCVALLMSGASVAFVWLALRKILNDHAARILVLPLATFYALTSSAEIVRYSGEQSAQLYFSIALWLLVTALAPPPGSISRVRLLLGGFFLGVLPFAKLQSAPLGVVLGGAVLVALLVQPGRPVGERVRQAAWLVSGVLLSAGLTLAVVVAGGSWFHFYKSYLVTGLAYTGLRVYANADFLSWVWQLAKEAPGLAPFFGTAAAAIVLTLPLLPRLTTGARLWQWVGGCMLLGAALVVWAPGRAFSHYLMFLIVPLGFLLAVLYGGLLDRPNQSRLAQRGWVLFFLGLTVVPQVYARYGYGAPPQYGSLRASRQETGAVVRFLQPLIRPGDSLTVWGWACHYHVDTQLPQGTREAHMERQIVVGPEQAYFRTRFLENLAQERPAFFIDAVGKSAFRYTDRNVFAHDRWSALQVVVNSHYRQIGEQENVRIYLRLDRIEEQAAELARLHEAGYR